MFKLNRTVFQQDDTSLLRGIRVNSKQELKERIIMYFEEVNQMPTVFKWKWKMNDMSIC